MTFLHQGIYFHLQLYEHRCPPESTRMIAIGDYQTQRGHGKLYLTLKNYNASEKVLSARYVVAMYSYSIVPLYLDPYARS